MVGDAGYQGVEKRPENQGKTVKWLVAMKRSVCKALPADELGRLQDRFEKLKASIRAKVEYPFHVIKNLFLHRKTRYRGLAKNEAQLFSLSGFPNLLLARRRMSAIHGQGASLRREFGGKSPQKSSFSPESSAFERISGKKPQRRGWVGIWSAFPLTV